ncbi:hypothetical protein Ate02nite_92560 [Paractinoplanes tereljensis]|uniref:Uncharacterized protein n=1 Tax=Paractinoplanes tereljensis TaxID=571912 RepID=A0A919TXN9_9ACTN|nr:hypothetical protein Ate02nite_92560 [Actinoplanes tereljensis]
MDVRESTARAFLPGAPEAQAAPPEQGDHHGAAARSPRYKYKERLRKADPGGASAVTLPAEESERRSQATTPAWPIMYAVLHGVSRDQFMARHKANALTATRPCWRRRPCCPLSGSRSTSAATSHLTPGYYRVGCTTAGRQYR